MLCLYKKIGETPLQCLDELRLAKPEYKNTVLSYAGRLDPMAEGLMLVLVDEENKEREKYLGLDKEYECEVLLGVGTDTYDILGKVVGILPEPVSTSVSKYALIESHLASFVGRYAQKYPPYSSKTLHGKALFEYAKSETLLEEDTPSREVEVYGIEIISIEQISLLSLETRIFKNISLVTGDFRQAEIIEKWKSFFKLKYPQKTLPVIKIKVVCGSGVYIRSIANELGKKLGVPALALSILRTKVGEYDISKVLNFR